MAFSETQTRWKHEQKEKTKAVFTLRLISHRCYFNIIYILLYDLLI